MARDGTGTFNLPQPPFVSGTVISSTAVNSDFSDIANALTQSMSKDGQTTPTANQPMATYRHTGVGNASARTDYAAAGQVQDGAFVWCETAGGTADALTLTPSPAITAYATGAKFRFKASSSANTGAATVAISGLTTKALQLNDAALVAGDIAANKYYEILYDGTAFQIQRVSIAGGASTSANNTWTGTNNFTGSTLQRNGVAVNVAGANTIAIPAAACTARTTNGASSATVETTTNDVMLAVFDFDAATSEAVQIMIPMPKSWNEGTITAQFFWTAASGSGAVVWGCRAQALSDDDAIDSSWGTAQTATDTLTAVGDLMISAATSAITIGGTPAENDLIVLEFYRDAAAGGDTLAADARLVSVKIGYTTNAENDA